MSQSETTNAALPPSVRLVSDKGEWPELPRLQKGQQLDLKSIRDPQERVYLLILTLVSTIVGGGILVIMALDYFEYFSPSSDILY